jgi:2-keto-4-pentenoate hydratase
MSPAWANTGQEALARALASFATREQMASPLPELGASLAIEIQDLLALNLAPDYGAVAGYLCEQADDGETVVALLLENMFTSSGATLDGAKGSDQAVQLGLLVRVRSEAIGVADAASSLQTHFSELIPAVIVRDQLLSKEQTNDWAAMTAVNTGVRYLVLGEPWPIAPSAVADFLSAPLEATLTNKAGEVLTKGKGLAGNQKARHAVWVLQQRLASRGRTLRAGELLSLGPVGPAVVLSGIGRVTANFRTALGEGQIVFALRPSS